MTFTFIYATIFTSQHNTGGLIITNNLARKIVAEDDEEKTPVRYVDPAHLIRSKMDQMGAMKRRYQKEERRVLLVLAGEFAFQAFSAEDIEECNDQALSPNTTVSTMLERLVKRGWLEHPNDDPEQFEFTDDGRTYVESTVNGNTRPFDDPGDRPWDFEED